MERGSSWELLGAAIYPFAATIAALQEVKQRDVHRLVRHDAMKGETEFAADGFDAETVRLELALVVRAHGFGIEVDVLLAFDILKQHRAVEIKRQCARIKDSENHHFMSGGGEPGEVALQFVN